MVMAICNQTLKSIAPNNDYSLTSYFVATFYSTQLNNNAKNAFVYIKVVN